jgi:hypothetical protein
VRIKLRQLPESVAGCENCLSTLDDDGTRTELTEVKGAGSPPTRC